jgi:ribosomal protein S17E
VREGTKTLDKNKRMPKPNEGAAPADDKSQNAAGSHEAAAADNKAAGDKGTNPTNGQSIAQVAGAEKPKADGAAGNKADEDDKGDDQRHVIKSLTKENRELKKMIRDEVIPAMKELQEQVKRGGTSAQEAKDELDAIAEKWELKPEFVKELSSLLLNKSKKQFEDEYLSDIKDIKSKTEEQSKQVTNAQITAAISKEFDRVIAENPSLAKVAKKEAVKKYIMSSEDNLSRSMDEIIDELYGEEKDSAGIEGYSSQGGNHPKEVDFKSPTEEDHKRIAQSREKGGKEFESYQESLIDRLTHRSRHRK